MTGLIDKISNAWDKTLVDVNNGVKNIGEKFWALSLILGVTLTTNYAIESCSKNPEYESACEFYRGYNNINDGEMLIARHYVFDHQRKEDRGKRLAEYVLEGDVSIGDTLPLHKRYCFTFDKTTSPNKLVSITKDTSNSVIAYNNISEKNK